MVMPTLKEEKAIELAHLHVYERIVKISEAFISS